MLTQNHAPAALEECNVDWASPSVDAAGSMPIGNGEVVLNVWVEAATGDLLFYVARTDAISEISRFLKLGRIRVHAEPSPWKSSGDFHQKLDLYSGAIEFSGGGVNARLFVDSASNNIFITGKSSVARKLTATVECWRNEDRKLPKDEQGSSWSVHDAPFDLIESKDEFLPQSDSVVWYHRNKTSVVPALWENQSLTGLAGTFDPLINRTFGGRLESHGFAADGRSIRSKEAVKTFEIKLTTHTMVAKSVTEWKSGLDREARRADADDGSLRTAQWWNQFWDRSWVFVSGDRASSMIPANQHDLRLGVDSGGGNVFAGEFGPRIFSPRALESGEIMELASSLSARPRDEHRQWPASQGPNLHAAPANIDLTKGLSLSAWIKPSMLRPGRIFDKLTAGLDDGFLFDTYPGNGLRLIVGNMTMTAPNCIKVGVWQHVAAPFDPTSGSAVLYVDGKEVARRYGQTGSPVTKSYALQRYVQACQGRGAYPIKFNGGFFTVEPAAMGKPYNADWRQWGDSHWWQNVRHMYHPMLAAGDFEMTDSLFRLYESNRVLAESRTAKYHNAQGAYFPETMTVFGTYSGGDYGWDRTGHEPKDVQCAYWQYAWNQGLELVNLMLDQWEYTRDEKFLKTRILPMSESVLRYFDTRFKKDANGRIVLDPTQSAETYWTGVVNDMPSTAGLISVTRRLKALPSKLTSDRQKQLFDRLVRACPVLPLRVVNGEKALAPAEKYDPATSNVENTELYAVWPFKLSTAFNPLGDAGKLAYAKRLFHLDNGWGYDGNAAAVLGLTGEAERILIGKTQNSNAAYRWPATWGPNFDWLPDQNHGGNVLTTTQLMLLQCDPIDLGGAIHVLPAWPKTWDVDTKLCAPGNTTVRIVARQGKILSVDVTPKERAKDIVLPAGWDR